MKTLSGEETELVWLPKRIVAQVKEVTDDNKKEAIILSYIKSMREDIECYINLLDEDVVRFKGLMITARREFEKTKNEEYNATYSLWENFEKELPKLKDKVQQIKDELKPLKNDVEELNRLLGSINMWSIQEFLKTIREISNCLDNKNSMELIQFLINNFRKEETKIEA